MSRPYPKHRPWMLALLALACSLLLPGLAPAAPAATAPKTGAKATVAASVARSTPTKPKTGARATVAAKPTPTKLRAKSRAKAAQASEPGLAALPGLAELPELAPAASPPRPKPPAGARPSRDQVQSMIAEVARQYGVERELVAAVVASESNYNAHAVSPVGAVGLMQVMPATAGDYGVDSHAALFDPKTNLRTGTRHLKRLLSKYGNDYGRAIMAYNAGEGVVDRTHSNVTYLETLNYTESVIANYRRNGGAQPTQGALLKVRALRGTLRSTRNLGKARRLLKRYLDPSLLSLKVRPTLSLRLLNPALLEVGPESRPMFELGEDDLR